MDNERGVNSEEFRPEDKAALFCTCYLMNEETGEVGEEVKFEELPRLQLVRFCYPETETTEAWEDTRRVLAAPFKTPTGKGSEWAWGVLVDGPRIPCDSSRHKLNNYKGRTMNKRTICVDFDGVLHSYTSGWKGIDVIPDPPVPGALEWLVEMEQHFEVAIYSTRSSSYRGRRAMRKWLRRHLVALAPTWDETPKWLQDLIASTASCEPWDWEVSYAVGRFLGRLKWPKTKPPAHLTLDDRAMNFTGLFPTRDEVGNFLPWYKRPNHFYEKGCAP